MSSIFDTSPWALLYNDAVQYPEARATTLIANWLRELYFPVAEGFIVDQENPTRDHHDLSRMDVAVKTELLDPAYAETKKKLTTNTWVYWLPGEGKIGKAGPKKMLYGEQQAYTKVWNYLDENRKAIQSCWVITYYGPNVRLWACQFKSSGFLVPFYPDGEMGDITCYANIKTNAAYFDIAFAYIKQHLQPDPEKFEGFWKRAAEYVASDGTLPFPVDSSVEDEPAGIHWKNLTQVTVLEVLEVEGIWKTKVQYPDDEKWKAMVIQFPLDYWREAQPGEIRVHQNMSVTGYIAPEVLCWAWTLDCPDSASSRAPDSEVGSDPEESDAYSSKGNREGAGGERHRDKQGKGNVRQAKHQDKKKDKDKKGKGVKGKDKKERAR